MPSDSDSRNAHTIRAIHARCRLSYKEAALGVIELVASFGFGHGFVFGFSRCEARGDVQGVEGARVSETVFGLASGVSFRMNWLEK